VADAEAGNLRLLAELLELLFKLGGDAFLRDLDEDLFGRGPRFFNANGVLERLLFSGVGGGGGALLFVFVIYGAVTGAIKNSDAYQEGMARARANPEVVAALVEPIESGFWVSGSINVNGSSGDVDVSIPISGPKGAGTLYVVGTRSAGLWQYSAMEVEVPDRASRIDLRPDRRSSASAPGTAVLLSMPPFAIT